MISAVCSLRWNKAVFELLSIAVCCSLFLSACGAAGPGPLSITLEHPETKQTLVCAAKDQLGRSDPETLAGAVENCARTLETRGFVRQ